MTVSPSALRGKLRRSRGKIIVAVIVAWAIALMARSGIGFVMLMTGAVGFLLYWSGQSTRRSSGGSGDGSDGGDTWWSSGSGDASDSSDGGGDGGGGGGDGGD